MFRFFPNRKPFTHDCTTLPLMAREEAATLVGCKDKASQDKLIEGHMGLVKDIVGRALAKLDLPCHLGEELLAVGLLALTEAVPRLTKKVKNVRAYLSKAIDTSISDFVKRDSLCPVPPRTQRDRKKKGKPFADAPLILKVTDIANLVDEEAEGEVDGVLSSLQRTPSKGDLEGLADIYPYCSDAIDRAIVYLRYDSGAGPRCPAEVADLLGISLGKVRKRLDQLEDRLYEVLARKKPTTRRSPGKKIFRHSQAELPPCSIATEKSSLVSLRSCKAHSPLPPLKGAGFREGL